jgi:hypothetical protein
MPPDEREAQTAAVFDEPLTIIRSPVGTFVQVEDDFPDGVIGMVVSDGEIGDTLETVSRQEWAAFSIAPEQLEEPAAWSAFSMLAYEDALIADYRAAGYSLRDAQLLAIREIEFEGGAAIVETLLQFASSGCVHEASSEDAETERAARVGWLRKAQREVRSLQLLGKELATLRRRRSCSPWERIRAPRLVRTRRSRGLRSRRRGPPAREPDEPHDLAAAADRGRL